MSCASMLGRCRALLCYVPHTGFDSDGACRSPDGKVLQTGEYTYCSLTIT